MRWISRRRFPPAVMVTTKGFTRHHRNPRGNRDDLWDTYKEMAEALHPPARPAGRQAERIDYSGARRRTCWTRPRRLELARVIKKRGVKTIAICFANSFMNPANEQRMRDILAAELPDAVISTSSDIMPEIFEHERFSTTVANAVLAPVVGNYAKRLESRMKEGGYKEDVMLLHSGVA